MHCLTLLCVFTLMDAAVRCQVLIPDDLSALFLVEEESSPQTYLGNIVEGAGLANIFNSTVLRSLEYGFIPELDSSYINLDPSTGDLHTLVRIDREELCPGEVDCYINFGVGIIKPSQLFQVISVQISVLDINDRPPVFNPSIFKLSFSEADPVGTIRTLPVATDADSPSFGIKDYRLVEPSTEFGLIQVDNPINGMIDLKLVLREELDRESQDFYTIRIEAVDGGSVPLTGQLTVEVTVEDDNDHSPRFGNDLYETEIAEDTKVNTVFYTVQATDADYRQNARIVYGFSPTTAAVSGHLFAINRTTGQLSLTSQLDYERKQVYHLEVTATDQGSNPRTGVSTVKVYVIDVNDNVPQITISTLSQKPHAEVMENSPSSNIAAHVSVYDADSGQNGQVVCDMQHRDFELRSLRVNQYKIVTTRTLDRELTELYVLRVQCTDLGGTPLAAERNLTVVVLDQNDNSPVFGRSSYSGSVPENLPEGSYVTMVNATDRDSGENARLEYQIVDLNATKYVRINPDTGVILAARRLDYEEVKELKFDVRVMDHGNPARTAQITVSIQILDQNDVTPAFERQQYVFDIEENKPPRSLVGKVKAVDLDSPPYNVVDYSLYRQNSLDHSLFTVDQFSGYIYTLRTLDHEERTTYYLSVVATDVDNPTLVSSATVTVHVLDVNDNPPTVHFPKQSNSTFPISNRVRIGYNVTKIFATDPDSDQNGNISFSIASGNRENAFRIDHTHGYVQSNALFTDVSYREYRLGIQIRDNGTPSLLTSVFITVVVDENIPFFAEDVLTSGIVQRTNLTIIIVVGAVSGFVIVVLIIAIVVLKTTDCRCPDGGRLLRKQSDGHGKSKGFSDVNIKAVEANGYLQQRDLDRLPTGMSPALIIHDTDDIRQHKVLREADNQSLSSADVSNTDSGRGLSEEGDTGRHSSSTNKHNNELTSSVHGTPGVSVGGAARSGPYGGSYGQGGGYQNRPRYRPPEGSGVTDYNTPDMTSDRGAPVRPYPLHTTNGAHGYNRYNGARAHYVNPPPYHQVNSTGFHDNQDAMRPRDTNSHVTARPPPPAPTALKAVNV